MDTFKLGNTLIQNVGIGHKSAKNVHSAQLKLFERCAVAPKLRIRGFPVDETAKLSPGQFIYANHFLPGQYVDVQGTRYVIHKASFFSHFLVLVKDSKAQ